MNNRPTPETDAFAIKFKTLCGEKYWVPVDIARKIERERDEARKHLEDVKEYGTEEINAAVELRQKLAQTLIERDEARRKLNDLNVTVIHSCHNECQMPICVLRRERDEARVDAAALADKLSGLELRSTDELARLEQERNEARENRENSRQSLAFALEELDEARKEAHRFRALHYSHLGINGSASWFPWESKLGHE